MAEHITGMSLRDVRKLLDDRSMGERAFEALDQLIDAALIFSPAVLGPAGFALHALLEPKDHLVALCKNVVQVISKPDAGDYLDQAESLTAANCLLTFTAYFEALDHYVPEFAEKLRLSEEEKRSIAAATVRPTAPLAGFGLDSRVIAVPHPATTSEAAAESRMRLYREMSVNLMGMFGPDTPDRRISRIPEDEWLRVDAELQERLPAHAERIFRAELVGLAIDFPQFLTWLTLADQDAKDALITKIGTDTRIQFEMVGRTVDLGLRGLAAEMDQLSQAMAALSARSGGQPPDQDLAGVSESLHRGYVHQIDQPVIDDRYEPARGARLTYPTRSASYVPQAYRLARSADRTETESAKHLERDDAWADRPLGDDLGQFVLRYLESAYSTQSPLLILGHPGSGKSLLTQILAARLAYPGYTTVRVELRDADPKIDIQRQIEAQIRKDTGEDVPWARFARTLPSPPVVILDGYDELLQATGSLYADFLDQVRLFQERELVQRRPLRVIVTSRITLIDKAIVPADTTIVRLEEFDELRRDTWADVWNAHNGDYFTQSGVRPFRLPAGNEKILELAAQPLLLLMLALYDSAANQLSSRPDIDQTRLYHELLTRFIRRELGKEQDFRQLPAADQRERVARELERLGVAAIGMFNRQSVSIRREDLNKDLAYFAAEQGKPGAGSRPLTQADLLLGSFFFIHESRGGDSVPPGTDDRRTAPATFEFLHKTFGEFLTADFILRQVLTQTDEVTDLASNPRRAATLQRHLELLGESWFGCLVHTPLHTQPNVLLLLGEWVGHRLAEENRSGPALLESLDKIILVQLRRQLTDHTLPALVTRDEGMPYARLPALGHTAIYSLNLLVLRAHLAYLPYVLDEADLGGQSSDCRAWDRLAAIWRSWFPPESLAALAARFTPTREGSRITIEVTASPLFAGGAGPFLSAYNASIALADDLATASLGLHLMSLIPVPEDYVTRLSDRAAGAASDLIPAIDFAETRTSNRPPGELPALSAKYVDGFSGESASSAPENMSVGHLVEFADLADRLLLSPAARGRLRERGSNQIELASLSRYAAEVVVHFLVVLEADDGPHPVMQVLAEDWGTLLTRPAAAPILRAAVRQPNDNHLAELSRRIAHAVDVGSGAVFDVDTATGAALLAWRTGFTGLCLRMLDVIIGACELGEWRIFDIPEQLWGDLADLLVCADPDIAHRRASFASLINGKLDGPVDALVEETGDLPDVEFVIHAMRISGRSFVAIEESTRKNVFEYLMRQSGKSRALFFLLLRVAREMDDRALVYEVLSLRHQRDVSGNAPLAVLTPDMVPGLEEKQAIDTFDVERYAMEMNLTYRELMDFGWAIDVARDFQPGT
ncbi:MAG TPA: ATP-binding protein [Trebonia sp.]